MTIKVPGAKWGEWYELYTLRDIEEGEELVVDYGAAGWGDVTKRRRWLRHRYNFECNCPRCVRDMARLQGKIEL